MLSIWGSIPNTMGYNRKIRNIAGMLIFGTFLVQSGNLIMKTDKHLKIRGINIKDLPGSSCHGIGGHQHFRNQCQQKKMLACNTRNSDIRQLPSTSLHTAFVYELQHHRDSSLLLGGSLRWFEVPKKKIYLQLDCFPDMQVGESG